MGANAAIDGIDCGPLAPAADSSQDLVFAVAAEAGSAEFGIAQAFFMFNQAKTTAFTDTLTLQGDEMRYTKRTILDIFEKKSYDDRDVKTLRRTG